MSEESVIETPDPKDLELQQAQHSLKVMEAFANEVIAQRNEAQNTVAQLTAQLKSYLGGN